MLTLHTKKPHGNCSLTQGPMQVAACQGHTSRTLTFLENRAQSGCHPRTAGHDCSFSEPPEKHKRKMMTIIND